MRNENSIQWKRLGAEAVAIVGSILLAFAIDAWWEDRQVRIAEGEILSGLIADLEQKQQLVSENRLFARAIKESAEKLLFIALNDNGESDPAEIDRLLGDLWWYNAPQEWTTGYAESLALSGQLSSISDARLQNALSSIVITLRSVGQYAAEDKNFLTRRQLPYMAENAFMPQILNAIEHMPGRPDQLYVQRTETSQTVDHRTLLQQRQFQNLVIERIDLLKSLEDLGWSNLEPELGRVLELLYAERERNN